MDIEVNLLAVVLGSVASMALGFLWYSPFMFGQVWMKLMGYTHETLKKAQKEMGPLYMVSFVVSLIGGFVLSHTMTLAKEHYEYSMLITGSTTALWMWLGFVMPVQLTDSIFGSKKWKLFMINTGYQMVSLQLIGLIIALID